MAAAEALVVMKRLREFPEDSWTIDRALDDGAYDAARKVVTEMTPDDLIEFVKAAGLRGKGGAGFPTGVKWSFVPKDVFPKYIVVNHDEGEPGTFKDRELAEKDPHQLIEGIIIAAWANQANKAFIYCRGEFALGSRRMDQAIAEAYDKGFLGQGIFGSDFDLDIVVHRGAGAYICGEESALARFPRGLPRSAAASASVPGGEGSVRPADRHQQHRDPVVAAVAIVERGRLVQEVGDREVAGDEDASVSGHVNKPGNYEVPLGTSLADVLELAGGMIDGRPVKAIIPGGASAPLLTDTSIPMDFEALKEAGSMLGSGAVVFMDDTTVHGAQRARHHPVLRARVVRQVHALSRRNVVGGQGARAHRARRGPPGGHGPPAGHLRRDGRSLLLPAGRCGVVGRSLERQAVPRGVRAARHRRALPLRGRGVDAGRRAHRARCRQTPV